MSPPRVLILRAPGTNCDEETEAAWQRAGAAAETWHINRLLEAPEALGGFQVLTIPGGFSYGDDLGAGRILATRLGSFLGDALWQFHARGGLILGICNGFQVLVKAGLLPGGANPSGSLGTPRVTATLTHNASGRFEARWVRLAPTSGRSPFVTGVDPIELPVAHGEGRFLLADPTALAALESTGQVVLRYIDDVGRPTQSYPENPNGSPGAVAGICDPTGRIFGLMPHPERYVDLLQHPRWTRRGPSVDSTAGDGLQIFRSAVAFLQGSAVG
jgi:phosphoribosylformylglycinamidine synthase